MLYQLSYPGIQPVGAGFTFGAVRADGGFSAHRVRAKPFAAGKDKAPTR